MTNEASARVIVRFEPATASVAQPSFLAALAGEAHVTRIERVRIMSGDAYVLRIVCADPRAPAAPDPCPAAIARIGAVPSVVGIEVDVRERY